MRDGKGERIGVNNNYFSKIMGARDKRRANEKVRFPMFDRL